MEQQDRYPDFVIAGAARSGTTALASMLDAHESVAMTDPKEPHFLALADAPPFTGPGDDVNMNRRIVRSEAAYRGLFAPAADGLQRGEGSVSSLYYAEAATTRLREVNPDCRVVIILREPVERAFSAFQYLQSRGLEQADSFSAGLAAEDDRVGANWHHLWHYRRMSLYAGSVTTFLRTWGADRVGIWFYEDLESRPDVLLPEVLDFLHLEATVDPAITSRRVNVSGDIRSKAVASVLSGAARVGFVQQAVKKAVPFRVREAIRRANLRSATVAERDRRTLAPHFERDRAELEAVLTRYGYRSPSW